MLKHARESKYLFHSIEDFTNCFIFITLFWVFLAILLSRMNTKIGYVNVTKNEETQMKIILISLTTVVLT
jgi:hypothetical protein